MSISLVRLSNKFKCFAQSVFSYLATGTFRWFLHHWGSYAFEISLRGVSTLRVAATALLHKIVGRDLALFSEKVENHSSIPLFSW